MTEPIRSELPYCNLADLLQVRNRQISAVHTISRELSATLDLDERLEHILTVSMDAVQALAGSILLYRASDNKLVFRHVVGPNSARLIGFAMKATEGIAGAVFQSGSGRISNDPRGQEEHRRDVSPKAGFTTESMVTVPLKFEEGQPVGVMQVLNKLSGVFDESDLEVLEILASIAATAIRNAQLHREAQLSAVAHAVGELAHDIGNKLTPISLGADTLQPMIDDLYVVLDALADTLPSERKEQLLRYSVPLRYEYSQNLNTMKEMVQEILDYTRPVSDALKGIITEPEMVPNDLNAIVARQVDQLARKNPAAGVRIVKQLNEIPSFRFDKNLTERAVYNLVNNAIPETPAGGEVCVRTGYVRGGTFPDGEYALIEVKDTGRGMPAHTLERILSGDPKSTKVDGTGLGTRVVINAVRAHRGLLEGESTEGVGTCFRIKLPFLA